MSRRERQRRKRRNQAGPQKAILLTLGLLVTVGLIAAGGVVGWVISVANSAPPLDTSKPIELGATSRVYAADGTRLGFIQANELRTPVASTEIPQNVNKTIGNLGLSAAEEDQLVAFLKTLTDGYTPPAVKNLR